jgi:hypothetical protein
VPTPESAAAFAKLAEARARLNDISVELREALDGRGSVAGDRRYREVQAEWDRAFRAFELATEELSAAVKRMHGEVEARRASELRDTEA